METKQFIAKGGLYLTGLIIAAVIVIVVDTICATIVEIDKNKKGKGK